MKGITIKQRPWKLAALMTVLALFTAACDSNATATPQPTTGTGTQNTQGGKKPVVYFATFAIGNAFWGLMERGAKDAGDQVGVEVVWTQGQEFSTEQTIERMNTAIAAKPDYMVVTDVDPSAMNPIIEKAKAAGIFVININAEDTSDNPPYAFYVGANEYKNGEAAGKAVLADARGAPKRAACAVQVQGHAGLEARCKGFTDVLQAANVTVDKIDVAGGPTEAEAKTKAYFTANTDAGAIYTLTAGPEAFDPVLKVLRDMKITDKVALVTNDTSDSAFDAIKSGEAIGAIDQQPYLQGYMPVIWAGLHSTGAFLPASPVYTGPFLITKDNVDRVQELIKANLR